MPETPDGGWRLNDRPFTYDEKPKKPEPKPVKKPVKK